MSKKNKKAPAYVACHTGNFDFYTHKSGAKLMCGGWSKSAAYDEKTVVIDLTGKEEPLLVKTILGKAKFNRLNALIKSPVYDWLNLPIKDFGLPKDMPIAAWKGLKDDILDVLTGGHNVLIACQGGHGRTGMVMSILGHLLYPNDDDWKIEPVLKLRDIYCEDAVDTADQENYVYKTLGLPNIANPASYKTAYQATTWQSNWQNGVYTPPMKKCPICGGDSGYYVDKYGLCRECQDEYTKKFMKEPEDKRYKYVFLDAKTSTCLCGKKDCMGIYMATCGDVVHGQKFLGDVCDDCYKTGKKATPAETATNSVPKHLGGELFP